MTKINLPPRKWYSLEKAIREIKKRTGEELDIEDLLHYWAIGKLDFSTRFIKSKYRITISDLIFNPKDIEITYYFSSKDVNLRDFNKFELCIFDRINNKNIEDNNNLNVEALLRIFPPYFIYTPESMREIINNGIPFYSNLSLISPSEFKDSFGINLAIKLDKEFHINLENICIFENDINRFLNNSSQNNHEKIFIRNAFKKTHGRQEKELKSIILNIAKATFEAKPIHSRNKLVNSIYNHLEKYYFEEYEQIDTRTIDNYLKEAGIGNQRTRSKEPVQIIDKYKTE
ncbi:hypothetical protein B0186_04475 [Canicola haemoglobinophilus]|uniref:Uncharacterized protein n=1 Tax=Canicola haemoglobinophilus TaxID=733 RepID=A0A1V4B1W8_9PAST|nr:hypothetical protein [Canicola haemoglobinophilus]OOS01187.1 hypothetical protein B0186_04475 [Canicola haemoglobinophilus]STO61038.1 Uncharacterised protein [Canicola haemoglobinophilus]